MPHQLYGGFGHLVDKGLVQPQPAPEKRSAAQQPPQHVAPPLVAGHNSIGNKKGQSTTMLNDYPHSLIRSFIRPILLPYEFRDIIN
ncbi:hypothetical protein ES708_23552 [subsurface metagenome]